MILLPMLPSCNAFSLQKQAAIAAPFGNRNTLLSITLVPVKMDCSLQHEECWCRDVFLESVSAYLSCAVCRGLLSDAVSTRCGHLFCEACLKEWTNQGSWLVHGNDSCWLFSVHHICSLEQFLQGKQIRQPTASQTNLITPEITSHSAIYILDKKMTTLKPCTL